MAVRVQNFPKKNFGSMPDISVNCTSWWNSNEQQFPQSLCKNLSLKVGSPPHLYHEVKQLALQTRDQDSSSSHSSGESHQEVTATGGTNSQEQCMSADSVQEESYRKFEEGQMKPVLFMGNPSFSITPSQVDNNSSVTQIPYGYTDPYFNGLFTAYGPQALVQPQMVRIAPARVPLPLELPEDGPIFVNAKQYHGILRRRQIRAKLEAQNKLVKNRRPYLHESRHRHALNRVRGSGGRFLPTKKTQQSKPSRLSSSHCDSDSAYSCQNGGAMSTYGAHQPETSKRDAFFQPSAHGFSTITTQVGEKWEMRGNDGLLSSGTHNRASRVR